MEIDIQQSVQAALDKLDQENVSPQVKQQIKKIITKTIEEGVPLKNAIGMSPELEELIYNHGYKLFQSGKYKEAIRFFDFLRNFDFTYRYNFAIAACHHYNKEYEDAIGNYLLCNQIEPENPVPYFHLYDCCTKLNQNLLALRHLLFALELAGRNPNYAALKERAQLEYKELQRKLKQSGQQSSDDNQE